MNKKHSIELAHDLKANFHKLQLFLCYFLLSCFIFLFPHSLCICICIFLVGSCRKRLADHVFVISNISCCVEPFAWPEILFLDFSVDAYTNLTDTFENVHRIKPRLMKTINNKNFFCA